MKITVDKHGYNVNELPQDMKDALKTYDMLPQHMKDDLKTYEDVSQNMVETLKNYEKLSQKWVWFDETRNELHDKNHEGENGDNIVNKGGLDGIATDFLNGNNLKEDVKREVDNIKNRAALEIQKLNKKQEIKCRESKREKKWMWIDMTRNQLHDKK